MMVYQTCQLDGWVLKSPFWSTPKAYIFLWPTVWSQDHQCLSKLWSTDSVCGNLWNLKLL